MQIQLDMYQTLAASVLVLMLGGYLKQKIHVLEKFCIPAPVVGGILFAIGTCICYSTGIMEISFDDTLREVCMVFFFTSVGFQANLKVLKSGGRSLAVFLGLVLLLIVSQNLLAIGVSHLLADRYADRYVHRLYSDGRRTWNSRSIWTGTRRSQCQGSNNNLHRSSHIWI